MNASTLRKPRMPASVALTAGAALMLSACSDAREALGIDRSIPDEFAVVSRAPLEMPPDLSLPPPTPGAPRPQEGTARDRAEAALAGLEPPRGQGVASTGPVSGAEAAFLQDAGAGAATPGIRSVVDREALTEVASDRSFIDRLMFWQPPVGSGTVVDPAAEARRIANNQALGRPVTEGTVPVIERRRRAPLEGVFDGLFDSLFN